MPKVCEAKKPTRRRRRLRLAAPKWSWVLAIAAASYVPWSLATGLTAWRTQDDVRQAVRLIKALDQLDSAIRDFEGAVQPDHEVDADIARGRARWKTLHTRYRRALARVIALSQAIHEVRAQVHEVERRVAILGQIQSNLLLAPPGSEEMLRGQRSFSDAVIDAVAPVTTATNHARSRLAEVSLGLPAVWQRLLLVVAASLLLAVAITLLVRFYQLDVSSRQSTEARLRETQARYELVVRGANDGMWDWNLLNGKIYVSSRWQQMLGLSEHDLKGEPGDWLQRLHPEDAERVKLAIETHVSGMTEHLQVEYRIRHKDGSYRWMLCRGICERKKDGTAFRIAGSQTDITDRRLAQERLIHDANHDPLTGLPNRTRFVERLRPAIARAQRSSTYKYGVLFLDLDRFKVINDSLGHMIGDQLLVAVSRTLEACVRPTDLVARLGGDEFTILLDGIRGEDDAIRVADRIQSAIVRPFNLSGQEVVTTVSIGIALSTTGYDGVEELMRDADTAMYRAKTLGRARYETFDKELHIQAMARMRIETELRRAIDAQELMLLYQPIIKVETGRICGFEALVRWPHPERGLVSPVEFIPIAEETGMIVPLGAWVLRTACFQLKAWRRRHPTMPALSVAVNLSPKQFQAPDLVEQVRDCIHDSGISPQHLKLEITEGVFLENAEQATDVINGLKGLGVELYIDDFGTGYSSLSYLQRLPIDKVKIDRSFVGRMEEGDEARTLVHTVIELAHNLGMTTVAEGVETARHVAILQDLGCEYAQGYFFARPLNARAASSLLARNPVYKRPQTAPPEPDQIQSRPAGPPPPPVPIRAHLAAK